MEYVNFGTAGILVAGINVYLLHAFEPASPLGEQLRALDDLTRLSQVSAGLDLLLGRRTRLC